MLILFQILGRICHWNHLDFYLGQVFNYWFNLLTNNLSVLIFFVSSWFTAGRLLLGIYPFPLSCPSYYHILYLKQFLTIQFSHSVISDSLKPHGLQHTRLPCPSPTPGAYSNSSPSNRWCHPNISASVIPFSPCLQFFPASRSFPMMSQFFTSGGQSIGVSDSASVLPMKIQDWFPLGLTGLISLQSEGLSRVFSNTTVQKHQFFSVQLSLRSNSHIHTQLLEKPQLWLDRPLLAK